MGDGADWDDGAPALYAEPLLSAVEEYRLFVEYRRTHDARLRERLILANTRLVRDIATIIHRKHPKSSLTAEDLTQEGMIGLMRAIEKFEPERGYKFSTMATAWIRQAIGRALDDTGEMIRTPVHAAVKQRRAQRLGEESEWPEWRVVSLDEPVSGNPDNDPLSSFIADERPAVEDVATDAAFWHSTLYRALGEKLSLRERYVVELRFGLSTEGDCWTLEQVGATMQITRERVRQIEATAIRKLRQALIATSDGEIALRGLDELAEARAAWRKKAQAQRMRALAQKRTKTTQQQTQTQAQMAATEPLAPQVA